jgi:hypothetical protein
MEGKYAWIVEKDLRSEVMNGQGTNNIAEEGVPDQALNADPAMAHADLGDRHDEFVQ